MWQQCMALQTGFMNVTMSSVFSLLPVRGSESSTIVDMQHTNAFENGP